MFIWMLISTKFICECSSNVHFNICVNGHLMFIWLLIWMYIWKILWIFICMTISYHLYVHLNVYQNIHMNFIKIFIKINIFKDFFHFRSRKYIFFNLLQHFFFIIFITLVLQLSSVGISGIFSSDLGQLVPLITGWLISRFEDTVLISFTDPNEISWQEHWSVWKKWNWIVHYIRSFVTLRSITWNSWL